MRYRQLSVPAILILKPLPFIGAQILAIIEISIFQRFAVVGEFIDWPVIKKSRRLASARRMALQFRDDGIMRSSSNGVLP